MASGTDQWRINETDPARYSGSSESITDNPTVLQPCPAGTTEVDNEDLKPSSAHPLPSREVNYYNRDRVEAKIPFTLTVLIALQDIRNTLRQKWSRLTRNISKRSGFKKITPPRLDFLPYGKLHAIGVRESDQLWNQLERNLSELDSLGTGSVVTANQSAQSTPSRGDLQSPLIFSIDKTCAIETKLAVASKENQIQSCMVWARCNPIAKGFQTVLTILILSFFVVSPAAFAQTILNPVVTIDQGDTSTVLRVLRGQDLAITTTSSDPQYGHELTTTWVVKRNSDASDVTSTVLTVNSTDDTKATFNLPDSETPGLFTLEVTVTSVTDSRDRLASISIAASTVESGDATLSALKLADVDGNEITLTPAFSSDRINYSATLTHKTPDVDVTATLNRDIQTLNGIAAENRADNSFYVEVTSPTSGTAGRLSGLIDGVNEIGISVTSQDQTKNEVYVVNLTRPAKDLVLTRSDFSVTENNTESYMASLTTQPTGDVTVAVSSSATGVATVSPASLTFTGTDWDQPQTVMVRGVSDDIDNGNTARTATITHDVSGADYASVADVTLTATLVDDDTAGWDISASNLTIDRDNLSAAYTVALTSEPTANVTVTLASSDTALATVSPTSITFTPTNWNVAVDVTATWENLQSSGPATITHTASGGGYGSIGTATVTVNGVTVENAGLDFSASEVTVDRDTSTISYTVALASQPLGSVSITVTSGDTALATVLPASLTFTTSNWSTPKTVNVTWVNLESSGPATITHSASGGGYGSIGDATVTVYGATVENASLEFSSNQVALDRDTGLGSYTVALASQPLGSVSVTVTSGDTALATVAPASLTFTTTNWSTPQTVDVTWVGAEDSANEVAITHAATGGGYGGTSNSLTARLGDKSVTLASQQVLPEVLRTVTAAALDGVSTRIEPGGRVPQGNADSFVSQLIIDADWHNNGGWRNDSVDRVSALAGQKRSMSISADKTSVWAASGYRRLSVVNANNLDWEGGVYSLQAGVDTALTEGFLVGISVGHARGDLDYTDNNFSSPQKGSLESTTTSVYPYVGWQSSEGHSAWAILGFGSGDVELGDSGGLQTSDTEQSAVAVGGRGQLLSRESGFQVELKAEAWQAKMELEANNEDIEALNFDVSRYRLILEGSKQYGLKKGSNLTHTFGLGLRGDSGEGVTGSGFEFNTGVQYRNPEQNVTARLDSRWLMSYSTDDADKVREWGVDMEVRYQPGGGERGMSIALKPSWGINSGSVVHLWNDGVSESQDVAALSSDARMALHVGYGLDGFGGLVTPYVEAESAGSANNLRIGALWKDRVTLTSLGIVGEQRKSSQGPNNSISIQLRSQW